MSCTVAWHWPPLGQRHLLPPLNLGLVPSFLWRRLEESGVGKPYIFSFKVEPLGSAMLQGLVLWWAPWASCWMSLLTGLQNWALPGHEDLVLLSSWWQSFRSQWWGRALALCCCSPVIEVLCPEVEGDVAVEHPSDQGNQEAESCPSLYILQK